MKHQIKAIKRIEHEDYGNNKCSKYPYAIWSVEIDGVLMTCTYFVTIHPIAKFYHYRFRFSNKGVVKHPDYPQIREELYQQMVRRYRDCTMDIEIHES